MSHDEPKKFQLQALPTKRISVNDSLSHDLFSMSAMEFSEALSGAKRTILEAKTAKHGKIESRYWLELRNIHVEQPLDEFDRDILEGCLSAQYVGNECITLKGIWHAITGTTHDDRAPTAALKEEILARIKKLAAIRITVDITDACKTKIYPEGTKLKLRRSLLPCSVIEAEVNGQVVDAVITFDKESPLLTLARARSRKNKQILTYDNALLDVPNQRKTPLTVAITNYIVRRVEAAKQHPTMSRTILLTTLARNCGLANATRWQRQDMRKTIESVMKSLVDKGEIDSFELVKERGQFTKITFNFKQTRADSTGGAGSQKLRC